MSTDLKSLCTNILVNSNIEKFNSMQLAAIEEGTKGNHLMLPSPTGSGKTLAFLSVVLNRLHRGCNGVTALIVVPSRELALQIEAVFRSLKTSFKLTCCYGGHAFKIEQQTLQEAPAIIIGTPGRIVDHIRRQSTDFSLVDIIVLDEFDNLLQMGFQNHMETIFDAFARKPQVILTSATAIDVIPEFVNLDRYKTIDFNNEEKINLTLRLVRGASELKVETLINLITQFNQEPTLVFCNHREAVERISILLVKKNFKHGVFHGGMEQIDREKSLIKFRSGSHNVLIATDLAARGLDIPLIKHIVHFQYPVNHSEFIHRNGRTARMHAEGTAYLILSDEESIPEYIDGKIEEFTLSAESKSYPEPLYECFYI